MAYTGGSDNNVVVDGSHHLQVVDIMGGEEGQDQPPLTNTSFGRVEDDNDIIINVDDEDGDPRQIVQGNNHTTNDERAIAAVRRAIEEELKMVENDNSTSGAALRAIMLRGVCRMPVVVGIGPDGQRTPADTTPTTTAATSSQYPSSDPSHSHPQDKDTSPPTS